MEYQNNRGGTILLKEVAKPAKETWNNALEAIEDALALEKEVNKVKYLKSINMLHSKRIIWQIL